MILLATLLACSIIVQKGCLAQLNSGSILSTSSLRTILESFSSNVFVSDDSSVYLLNGDLSEVVQMVRNEGQSPEGMALNSDQSKLIVCWANAVDSSGSLVNTAPCTVYDATTFASLVNVTLPTSFGVGSPRDETGQPRRDNRYGIGIGSDGSGGETFFAMSSLFEGNVKRLFHREYSISDGSIKREETPSGVTILDRIYYNGLKVGIYTYIIAKDTQNVGRIRVIRLCEGNSGVWEDWYEIQLICGTIDRNSADFRNTFIDASFLTAADGASEAMLVVTALSIDGSSDTCSFTLSSIDSAATRVFQYCVNLDAGNRRSIPVAWMSGSTDTCPTRPSITECDLHVPPPISTLPGGPRRLSTQVNSNTDLDPLNQKTHLNSFSSTSFSSTEVFLVDGVVVMFAGLPSGDVRKYTAASFTANEVNPTAERTWSLSSSSISAVKSLAHSTGSDYVYAVTDNMVHRLPVEECSNFTDCSSCVTSGGRLCGWCTVENKCSRTSQCSNSSDALRWVQTTGQCLSVSIASAMSISGDAKSYPREQGTIDVTIQNLPALLSGDSESFQCWFGQFGGGALVALGGTGYRCSVPAIPAFNGQDRQSVNFTLRSSLHSIDYGLVEDGVVFYDCAVRASCSPCVSSLNCNWCPVESTCATNSGGCSASAVSSSSSCPQLLPSSASGGRYYLYEGLTSPAVTLELNAMNLIGPTAGYSYSCELTNVSSTFTAAYNSATSVSCNINTAVTFSEPQRDSAVRLIWTNGSSNFAIESSAAMDQIATIYSCPRLGPDCSTCAGLNMNFDCVFCLSASTASCQLSTNCQSGMAIAFGEFLQCPTPMVTDATPTDGTLQGGTMYTISGNNLGNHPIENVTILFGGRLCNISSSTSGALVCVVPAGVSEGEVSVTLSRTGVSGHPVGTFTYKTPTVSKVTPVKTPLKGGSIVSVEGLNLDIGNSQSTRVEAVFRSSRRKRQVETRVQLDLIGVTPTMISCISPDVSGSVTMDQYSTISVIIDGNDFTDPDVLLEFVQPTFTALFDTDDNTPATILQGGGVPLVFIGTNLDAAVSPVLTIQPTGGAADTEFCTVTSSTMLSCLVPALSNVAAGTAFSYRLTLDSQVLANLAATQPLTAVLDPVFTGPLAVYSFYSGQPFTVSGTNLDNVRPEDYKITVGGLPCSNLTIESSTSIFCRPPQSAPGGQNPAPMMVTVSGRAGVAVGRLWYYVRGFSDPTGFILIVVVPLVFGLLIVCGFPVAIKLCCTCYANRKKKEKAKDEARAKELLEMVEAERENGNKKQEELEQHVENMKSQVTMMSTRMKDLVSGKDQPSGGAHYTEVKSSRDQYEEVTEGYEAMDGEEEVLANPTSVGDARYMDMREGNESHQLDQQDGTVRLIHTPDDNDADQEPMASQRLTKNPAYSHLPPAVVEQSRISSDIPTASPAALIDAEVVDKSDNTSPLPLDQHAEPCENSHEEDRISITSQTYVNDDQEPIVNLQLTKNPAYSRLPSAVAKQSGDQLS